MDARGHVLALSVGEGQGADYKGALPLLDAVPERLRAARVRRRVRTLVADKGYSFSPVRTWARQHRVRCNIPWREDQRLLRARSRSRFERALYRQRNVVERCVGHLKQARRVATRHEKLALNYLAVVQVAVIARHLRRLAPSDTT